jgi:hypothetical protein
LQQQYEALKEQMGTKHPKEWDLKTFRVTNPDGTTSNVSSMDVVETPQTLYEKLEAEHGEHLREQIEEINRKNSKKSTWFMAGMALLGMSAVFIIPFAPVFGIVMASVGAITGLFFGVKKAREIFAARKLAPIADAQAREFQKSKELSLSIEQEIDRVQEVTKSIATRNAVALDRLIEERSDTMAQQQNSTQDNTGQQTTASTAPKQSVIQGQGTSQQAMKIVIRPEDVSDKVLPSQSNRPQLSTSSRQTLSPTGASHTTVLQKRSDEPEELQSRQSTWQAFPQRQSFYDQGNLSSYVEVRQGGQLTYPQRVDAYPYHSSTTRFQQEGVEFPSPDAREQVRDNSYYSVSQQVATPIYQPMQRYWTQQGGHYNSYPQSKSQFMYGASGSLSGNVRYSGSEDNSMQNENNKTDVPRSTVPLSKKEEKRKRIVSWVEDSSRASRSGNVSGNSDFDDNSEAREYERWLKSIDDRQDRTSASAQSRVQLQVNASVQKKLTQDELSGNSLSFRPYPQVQPNKSMEQETPAQLVSHQKQQVGAQNVPVVHTGQNRDARRVIGHYTAKFANRNSIQMGVSGTAPVSAGGR